MIRALVGCGEAQGPAAKHCWTAASQPARLKMNVIAGSRPAPSSRSMISGRYGAAFAPRPLTARVPARRLAGAPPDA